MEVRNTRKNKIRENKKYPYKKGYKRKAKNSLLNTDEYKGLNVITQ
jgi:hypothetical protein